MKKYVSAIFTLAIISLALVSCEPNETPITSYKPTTDPEPEQMTSFRDIYESYKACLSKNYSNGKSVNFLRENGKKETLTVTDLEHQYDNDEGYIYAYSYVVLESDNCIIDLDLTVDGEEVAMEDATVDIKYYTSMIMTNRYVCNPLIIHSGDKIYLKDEKSGQYICVMQKGKGILYVEDNAGHSWSAK